MVVTISHYRLSLVLLKLTALPKYRTEVEKYESTVKYRALWFHNSCFLKKWGKQTKFTPSYFYLLLFYNSSSALVVFNNCGFPQKSHLYQVCSAMLSVLKCHINRRPNPPESSSRRSKKVPVLLVWQRLGPMYICIYIYTYYMYILHIINIYIYIIIYILSNYI